MSVRAFSTKFGRLMDKLREMFPDDVDVDAMHVAMTHILRENDSAAAFMQSWAADVVPMFGAQLAAGDVDFFLTKNWAEDIPADADAAVAALALAQVDRLRNLVLTMTRAKQVEITQDLHVLCKLCK